MNCTGKRYTPVNGPGESPYEAKIIIIIIIIIIIRIFN